MTPWGWGCSSPAPWAGGVNIDDTQGFQRAPAWWTLSHKQWHYTDGSGQAGGYRTMMATLLASRMSLAQLQAQDAAFADLTQYLCPLQAPPWPFAAPNPTSVATGRTLFEAQCASCHGVYDGENRNFPDRVVPAADVGTDPVRATSFTADEANLVNASWFGADAPMRATGGYLAPDLSGVWATAPYLHNGSVPTLSVLLEPAAPAERFRLDSSYDEANVGWRYTSASPTGQATVTARKVYDTTAPGLSNAGHTYAAQLTPAERLALIDYLKTL